MIAFILHLIDAWLELAEVKRRDACLAGAKDLIDVERRMRALEKGHVIS